MWIIASKDRRGAENNIAYNSDCFSSIEVRELEGGGAVIEATSQTLSTDIVLAQYDTAEEALYVLNNMFLTETSFEMPQCKKATTAERVHEIKINKRYRRDK